MKSGKSLHREWVQQARLQVEQADHNQLRTPNAPLSAETLAADFFPGYELEHEVHRGGQGVVYAAVQRSTGRKVALKVLREGAFAGPLDRARFEREIQVLAALRHPNIVTIHDSGSAGGHFYFVMDFIAGRPLDAYLAAEPRSVRDTLELFAQICEAVDAAHVLGIIHRDLKPGNVRIAAAGKPYVLDFGLAKLVSSSSNIMTDDPTPRAERAADVTMTGQFLGSLPWAAPEQAEGSPTRIDTRTDVYALGVLLFQMLTGEFPYPVSGGMRAVLAHIVSTSPVRPRSLRREISDEVETIVLKCLSKERERRYQSAGELGRDVRRYLTRQPIDAKRDSFAYLLRKGIQRHWLPACVAAGFVVITTLGLGTSLALWQTAAHDRDRALSAEQREAKARRLAEADNLKLQATNRFVQNMLTSADPGMSGSGDISARALLDNAARELDSGDLHDQPEVEAAVRVTLGRAYTALGLYAPAGAQLETAQRVLEALPDANAATTGEVVLALAELRLATQDFQSAEAFARRALEIRRGVHGEQSAEWAAACRTLADVLYSSGRFDESVTVLRQALSSMRAALGDDDPHVAATMVRLANFLHSSPAEAEDLLSGALRLMEASGAQRTLRYGYTLAHLARVQHLRRDYAAAEQSYQQAIALVREAVGGPNRQVLNDLESLVLLYMHKGDWRAALETAGAAWRDARAMHGEDSQRAVQALLNMAASHGKLGEYVEGRDAARAALAALLRTGNDQSLIGAEARFFVAFLAMRCGELELAERTARDCLEIPEDVLAGQTWRRPVMRTLLGEILTEAGRYAEAEPLLLSGHEQLAARPNTPAAYRDEAQRRLVKLYDAWEAAQPGRGKAELGAPWRDGSAPASQAAPPAAPPK